MGKSLPMGYVCSRSFVNVLETLATCGVCSQCVGCDLYLCVVVKIVFLQVTPFFLS